MLSWSWVIVLRIMRASKLACQGKSCRTLSIHPAPSGFELAAARAGSYRVEDRSGDPEKSSGDSERHPGNAETRSGDAETGSGDPESRSCHPRAWIWTDGEPGGLNGDSSGPRRDRRSRGETPSSRCVALSAKAAQESTLRFSLHSSPEHNILALSTPGTPPKTGSRPV